MFGFSEMKLILRALQSSNSYGLPWLSFCGLMCSEIRSDGNLELLQVFIVLALKKGVAVDVRDFQPIILVGTSKKIIAHP